MYRRDFLSTLFGGVFVNAAVRTWPFRVYSFPSTIVIPTFASIGPPMSEILAAAVAMDLDAYMRTNAPAHAGFWAVTVSREGKAQLEKRLHENRILRRGGAKQEAWTF